MLHTKFQTSKPSSSEEEDFKVYFIFEPNTPAAGPVWTLGPPLEQTWQRSIWQCFIPNMKDLWPLVSDKKILEGFPYVCLCKTSVTQGEAIFPLKA